MVFDIQRVGPSTGLPTRTAQGDIATTAMLSHGDTKQVMLIPSSVEECFEMSMEAFDCAERLQQLVFVMSDLDLGMNMWMSHPFVYPEKPFDRGKVLDAAGVRALGAEWGRYADIDGDGIPYRTLPGTDAPSYFTRGSGHNARGQYSERPDDYQGNMDRLTRKQNTAKTLLPQPVVEDADTDIGIVAYGTTHWAVDESRAQLESEAGIRTAYLRIRAYPFSDAIEAFIRRYRRVYVVEQNRDAQMRTLLKNDLSSEATSRIRSVLHYNGLPIDARSVTQEILMQEGRSARQETVAAGVAGMTLARED